MRYFVKKGEMSLGSRKEVLAGMGKVKNLLSERISWWKMPFLDFIHAFLYFFIGLKAFFSKKVSWS
jgi:hypothetical protein